MQIPVKRALASLGIAAALFGTAVGPAFADPRDFTFVNATAETTVAKLYVAASDSDEWEEDTLGKDVLAPGETWTLSFSKYDGDGGKCLYDVKVVSVAGAESFLYKANLCELQTITLR